MTTSSSSLSSVVSNLVRASAGSSVPSNVTDEELDRYVADLIVKEAKQKAERYMKEGVQAYLPEKELDSNLPKANKRFLSAIIRNTDEHNKAILKAKAEAAMEARAEIEEQERKEKRARALEATEAERLRRLMGGSSRRLDRKWDRRRDSGRRRESRDTPDGDNADYEDELRDKPKRKRRSRSRSPTGKDDDSSRRRSRRRRDEGRDTSSSRRRRRRSRSRSPIHERRRSSRKHESSRKHRRRDGTPDPPSSVMGKGKGKEVEEPSLSSRPSARATPVDDEPSESSDEELRETQVASGSGSGSGSRRSRTPQTKPYPGDLSIQFKERKARLAATPPPPASPTLSEEEDIERFRPRRRRRPSTGPLPDKHDTAGSQSPSTLPSKMDKYFEESYDPRLDTGPLVMPEVPSTGLIEGAEFEGWEAMLEIIRQRREDKAERKRLERLGLLPDNKAKEKAKETSKSSEAWTMESGTNALDIKYNKRGTVREWDLGKTGF